MLQIGYTQQRYKTIEVVCYYAIVWKIGFSSQRSKADKRKGKMLCCSFVKDMGFRHLMKPFIAGYGRREKGGLSKAAGTGHAKSKNEGIV